MHLGTDVIGTDFVMTLTVLSLQMLAESGQPLHLELHWTCYLHHYGMFCLILGSMHVHLPLCVLTKWEEKRRMREKEKYLPPELARMVCLTV